ncbi:hypothetical protein [Paraburkholderia sp. BCC1884]|uniref:hypothetical protein n=1 Tax=Paraburkholderia sp. BCC1884 TaxID=2562668 RepID=UPI0011836306|nr:hypothetical protein [Paraburkholderia sp. BCC1884]
MKKQIIRADAAARLDPQATGLSYLRCRIPARSLFAAPQPDLMTLVIAEAIRRKAQAQVEREGLRDALYEMPVSREREDRERGVDIHPSDTDD